MPPDADQFLQFPLAVFTLFEDLHLLVLHQIVKQGINQRDEPDTLFVHRQGTGDNNFVFIHQLLLQASQGDRFATCHLPLATTPQTAISRPSRIAPSYNAPSLQPQGLILIVRYENSL